MRTICVLSPRRGAGKTSLIVNLGACLADAGRQVLVIDIDPEAGLDLALGAAAKKGTYEVLAGAAPPGEVVIEGWGMDLMLGLPNLSKFHGEASTLREALADIRYDYVFLDMPPVPGILTYNAYAFADEAFIVTAADPLAVAGVGRVFESVAGLRQTYNPRLAVTGIVITSFDPRDESQHDAVRALRSDFGALVFRTRIRYSVDLITTRDKKQPVIFYRSSGPAADDYRELAREVEHQAESRR
jgi:chromosome partitioning protein